jgi:hypothetical protein
MARLQPERGKSPTAGAIFHILTAEHSKRGKPQVVRAIFHVLHATARLA